MSYLRVRREGQRQYRIQAIGVRDAVYHPAATFSDVIRSPVWYGMPVTERRRTRPIRRCRSVCYWDLSLTEV